MGRPVLLLRLEGPLQSWGTRSRWDVRDTATEPTKSAIVGLLGCALAYPVGDSRLETELDAGLLFGVRVESRGRVIRDYHTVTGFLPTAEGTYKHSGVKTAASLERLRVNPDATPATIISPRLYLEDASFLVALEEKPGFSGLLERCEAALNAPAWPMYLGRKACPPTRPILDGLFSDYEGIEDALRRHPWSWKGAANEDRRDKPCRADAYIEDPTGTYVRQDAVRTNQARQYGFRHARHMVVELNGGGGDDVSVNA